MRNSYKTFIEPVASLHIGDFNTFRELEIALVAKRQETHIVENDAIYLHPVLAKLIEGHRQERHGKRSRTTRCAFLAKTGPMQDYLDEIPDFEVGLKDAFDLYMQFLSA